MPIELKVPNVGESITEVEIGQWLKKSGDRVEKDEAIVEIESDKATVEVFAPEAGTIGDVVKKTGDSASIGDVIGYLEEGGGDSKKKDTAEDESKEDAETDETEKAESKDTGKDDKEDTDESEAAGDSDAESRPKAMPAARRAAEAAGISLADVEGSGKDGRVLKEDVERAAAEADEQEDSDESRESATDKSGEDAPPASKGGSRDEEVVRMTPMRRTIAKQLVEVQQNAAMLTTFNEADLTEIMELRSAHKESFEKKHGVRLGFMSFFVKASIEALKAFPAVNAEVQGENIVYKNYYDIGIAVSGKKGLVVPVLRNAERMSFAEIEKTIGDFGDRAQNNKIKLDELQGGTFTLTNGGIFGSMMSTPILNPPQSGILGMHAIQQRPVVRDGEIVARPMMYLALTYDHRIVDGREAVSFLVRIKECIENPSRILLEI